MSSVDEAVAAIRAGRPAVVPFDTVYGLAADPNGPEPVQELYRLKGREAMQPSALVAASLDVLLELVPELRGGSETSARALLPGQFTLVLANPARRFPWLAGGRPDAIGVRVPKLTGPGARLLATLGAVVATSANRPGEADPSSLDDVALELRAGAGAVVDGGRLPGTPSTVLDLTGDEPRVLRVGAVSAAEALRRLGAPVRSP